MRAVGTGTPATEAKIAADRAAALRNEMDALSHPMAAFGTPNSRR